jgi:hypothetical protein
VNCALAAGAALRGRYVERNGKWAHAIADQHGPGEARRAVFRRVEDAAHGPRWLGVARRLRFDLRRSLAPQHPLASLDAESGDERPAA